jgi:hypothetical protein
MAKVLKVVAMVAAIASIAVTAGASLGLSAAVFGAISAGAAIGGSLLQKRPKAPPISSGSIDRMRASIQ